MNTNIIITILIIANALIILRFLFKLNLQHENERRIQRDHEYEID